MENDKNRITKRNGICFISSFGLTFYRNKYIGQSLKSNLIFTFVKITYLLTVTLYHVCQGLKTPMFNSIIFAMYNVDSVLLSSYVIWLNDLLIHTMLLDAFILLESFVTPAGNSISQTSIDTSHIDRILFSYSNPE